MATKKNKKVKKSNKKTINNKQDKTKKVIGASIIGIVILLIGFLIFKPKLPANVRLDKTGNYYIIDGDYEGEYDITYVNISEIGYDIYYATGDNLHTQADYSEFCEKYNITQKYHDSDYYYLMIVGEPNHEVRLADIKIRSREQVDVYMWAKEYNFNKEVAAIITIPIKKEKVNIDAEIIIEDVYDEKQVIEQANYDHAIETSDSLEKERTLYSGDYNVVYAKYDEIRNFSNLFDYESKDPKYVFTLDDYSEFCQKYGFEQKYFDDDQYYILLPDTGLMHVGRIAEVEKIKDEIYVYYLSSFSDPSDDKLISLTTIPIYKDDEDIKDVNLITKVRTLSFSTDNDTEDEDED